MLAVGLIMQQRFFVRYKTQPPKENAKKTYSDGVHCFAHYPPEWRIIIESELNKYQLETDKQRDLF